MDTEEGAVLQNKGIDAIIYFVRENALVQEIGDRPSITGKGEQLPQEKHSAAERSESELTGVVLQ
jgi:hypothetical protein